VSAAFTSGPWAVNPLNAQVDAFDSGEPVPVCQLLWPTELRSEDETLANAALIATAPNLFDGLERAFLFICNTMPLGPTNDRTEAGKLIDSLRVPLATARGEP
jgi:hypothetical protein